MPQLALETFVSQYFWLVVLLTFLYVQMVTWAIPKIAQILKTRKEIGDVKMVLTESKDQLAYNEKLIYTTFNKADHVNQKRFNDKVVEWSEKTLKA